jgi:hypothetical protein
MRSSIGLMRFCNGLQASVTDFKLLQWDITEGFLNCQTRGVSALRASVAALRAAVRRFAPRIFF